MTNDASEKANGAYEAPSGSQKAARVIGATIQLLHAQPWQQNWGTAVRFVVMTLSRVH